MVYGSAIGLLLMLIMALCMIPMIITVRDGANSSELWLRWPHRSMHEPIPSVSVSGVLKMMVEQKQISRDVGGANPRS